VRKLTWNEKRELEALEKRIPELESQKKALMDAMASAGDDYVSLQRLSAQLDELDGELPQVEERWLELTEIAELAAQK
jgi:ATP-binding cassette subfamily F protein uup